MPSTITIDRAGRVVIPAELRRRLRLAPGTRLLVREEAGVLVLAPLPAEPVLEEEAGLLVAGGRVEAESADHRRVRDEHSDRLGGCRSSSSSP